MVLSDIIPPSRTFCLRPDEAHRLGNREFVVGSWPRWLIGGIQAVEARWNRGHNHGDNGGYRLSIVSVPSNL